MDVSPKEGIREVEETSEPEEEGRHIPGQKKVFAPSAEEKEAHMRTHIPYRRWCEYCVRTQDTGNTRENLERFR